jgi:hypothetical protein
MWGIPFPDFLEDLLGVSCSHYAHFCMEADRLSVSQGAISV